MLESTNYYDNPDWEGEPLAIRNSVGGGRTFIQAYFQDGENTNTDFYGDDGSVAYGVDQLRQQADGFRFDRQDMAIDRALDIAAVRGEIASRGPDWARAVGLESSPRSPLASFLLESIGDLRRMSQEELAHIFNEYGPTIRRRKGCPECCPDAQASYWIKDTPSDYPGAILWGCTNCRYIDISFSSRRSEDAETPSGIQQRSIDRIRAYAQREGQIADWRVKPDGYSGGFWVSGDIGTHPLLKWHFNIHVGPRGSIVVWDASTVYLSSAQHWAIMLGGRAHPTAVVRDSQKQGRNESAAAGSVRNASGHFGLGRSGPPSPQGAGGGGAYGGGSYGDAGMVLDPLSDEELDDIFGMDESNTIAKPPGLKKKMSEVSLGQDGDGYYVFTHRCRSDSYDSPEEIPDSVIDQVASTG